MRLRTATRRRGRAFTLVELLVVVAIICLLISILAPSMKRVKIQAQTLVCGTNVRTFANAFVAYGSEHNNAIVSCMEWVRVCQFPPWDAWPYYKDKTVVYNGVLWPYIGKEEVYICKTFASLNYWNKGNPAYGLSYSYSMNGNMNHLWGAGRRPWYVKFGQINRPASVFLMGEEMPDATPGYNVAGLNDGVLLACGYPNADSLAYLHGDGTVMEGVCNVVFADGRTATRHIWETDKVTYDP